MLLSAFGQTGGTGGSAYDARALAAVWRLSFAVGLAPLGFLLAYRLAYVKESELWSRSTMTPEARCLAPFSLKRCSAHQRPGNQDIRRRNKNPSQKLRGMGLSLRVGTRQAARRERAVLVAHFWHRLLGTAGSWFCWCGAAQGSVKGLK